MSSVPSRRGTLLAAVLASLTMAPTAGDVGGCGVTATELEGDRYAFARKIVDCERCRECGIGTARCGRACEPREPPDTQLPSTCRPLLHDGQVCLRALKAASCEAFAAFVDDAAPALPSECTFCRVAPEPPATDLGATR